jgi:hypothetical protein
MNESEMDNTVIQTTVKGIRIIQDEAWNAALEVAMEKKFSLGFVWGGEIGKLKQNFVVKVEDIEKLKR